MSLSSLAFALGCFLPLCDTAASVTAGDIARHVEYLASDELAGRGTGTDGERLAADYLARELAGYGLEPAGEDGTFFQRFDVPAPVRIDEASTLGVRIGPWQRDLGLGRDFAPFDFSPTVRLEGVPLVFAGYGVVDPERGYDDYAGLDVRGKAVVVLRREPGAAGRRRLSNRATFVEKARQARERGAAALLVVSDPRGYPGDDGLVPPGAHVGGTDAPLPAMQVRQSVIASLFRLAGRDLAAVQAEIDGAMAPRSFAFEATLDLDLRVERALLAARNVIARLPGADPALREEVIVIGAHYDHLGHGHHGTSLAPEAKDEVHNGADDNASGTAGLLELAQALAAGPRPARTVLFVGFSGEEMGLLGSAHFVEHPPLPLERVVAMVNLDMIGRLRDRLEVGGVDSSSGFRALVEQLAGQEQVPVALSGSGYGPSDHASFYAAGVPVLFFFTGLHDDYHRPSDDAAGLDAEGARRVTRLALRCVEAIASAPARPDYVKQDPRQWARGARLGIGMDREFSGAGVLVESVGERSPAATGRLRPGDVIVALGEAEVDSPAALRAALSAHQPGDDVEVVVLRGAERLTLKVKLGGW